MTDHPLAGELVELLALLHDIDDAIARHVLPAGGGLLCTQCQGWRSFNFNHALAYVEAGWPTCCGRPMKVRGMELAGNAQTVEAPADV